MFASCGTCNSMEISTAHLRTTQGAHSQPLQVREVAQSGSYCTTQKAFRKSSEMSLGEKYIKKENDFRRIHSNSHYSS